MEKIKRSDRLVALMRILGSNPNQVIPYARFCELFNTAKSSVSEDVALMQTTLRGYDLGEIITVTGASGGVCFRPIISKAETLEFISGICEKLKGPHRLLPGGYLYLSDMLSDPCVTRKMGAILAMPFYQKRIDVILTMETKGIPVALMTADALNVPLVIARRTSKVYEGSAVNISFPNSKGAIETMFLAKRAVRSGQRVLIVDDFIRNGGTARGMVSLMNELEMEVVGLAFVLAQETLVPIMEIPMYPLMIFSGDGEKEPIAIKPAAWLTQSTAEDDVP